MSIGSTNAMTIPTTPLGWVNLIKDLGTVGVLVVVIAAGAMGYVVPATYYDAAIRERDEWKVIALQKLNQDLTGQRGVLTLHQAQAVMAEEAPE